MKLEDYKIYGYKAISSEEYGQHIRIGSNFKKLREIYEYIMEVFPPISGMLSETCEQKLEGVYRTLNEKLNLSISHGSVAVSVQVELQSLDEQRSVHFAVFSQEDYLVFMITD